MDQEFAPPLGSSFSVSGYSSEQIINCSQSQQLLSGLCLNLSVHRQAAQSKWFLLFALFFPSSHCGWLFLHVCAHCAVANSYRCLNPGIEAHEWLDGSHSDKRRKSLMALSFSGLPSSFLLQGCVNPYRLHDTDTAALDLHPSISIDATEPGPPCSSTPARAPFSLVPRLFLNPASTTFFISPVLFPIQPTPSCLTLPSSPRSPCPALISMA